MMPVVQLFPKGVSFFPRTSTLFGSSHGMTFESARTFPGLPVGAVVGLVIDVANAQVGKLIASFQLIQDPLAKMISNITACQFLMVRMAQLQGEGKLNDAQTTLSKAFTTAECRERWRGISK